MLYLKCQLPLSYNNKQKKFNLTNPIKKNKNGLKNKIKKNRYKKLRGKWRKISLIELNNYLQQKKTNQTLILVSLAKIKTHQILLINKNEKNLNKLIELAQMIVIYSDIV